jgi:hypothetical protein
MNNLVYFFPGKVGRQPLLHVRRRERHEAAGNRRFRQT